MKTRVKEKDIARPIDKIQGDLETVLAETIKDFFSREEVKKCKFKSSVELDIMEGALLTLFVKHLAYHAAQNESFNYHTYSQEIFNSMSQLFSKCKDNFAEMLKEKNSSSH